MIWAALLFLGTRLRHAGTRLSRADCGERNARNRRGKSCSNSMPRKTMHPRLPSRVVEILHSDSICDIISIHDKDMGFFHSW